MIHHDHTSHCPACGVRHDAVTGLDTEDMPGPGDVSICFGCGAVLLFDDDLDLRRPTLHELDHIAHDPEIVAAWHAWRRLREFLIAQSN